MTPTASDLAFERFRQTLALPLMKVRVDETYMTYTVRTRSMMDAFVSLAKMVIETEELPITVTPDRDSHRGVSMNEYFITLQYNGNV
jgi:hypothetical protein